MVRKVASRLLFVYVMAALVTVPRPIVAAVGPTTDRFTEPFNFYVSAAEGCSGEDVHIYGTLEIHTQTNTDGKGNVHVLFHLTPHLVGVGLTTGNVYNPNGPSNSTSYIDANGTRVASGVNIITLISRGGAGNLLLKESYQLTVTPSGKVTVDTYEFGGGCHG